MIQSDADDNKNYFDKRFEKDSNIDKKDELIDQVEDID